MKFSKTTDYALRVMVALALSDKDRLSLQKLANKEEIPRKFLEHVVRSLKEAQLVESTPGPKGGYQLTRDPAAISIGDILQAIQGPLLPLDRLDAESMPDHLAKPVDCLRAVIADIRSFARQKLQAITLAHLAESGNVHTAKQALMYYI
jgi:Rrf2 family protein